MRSWISVILRPLLGPFGLESCLTRIAGLVGVVLAVVLIQIGAVAVWLGMGVVRRRRNRSSLGHKFLAGCTFYAAIWLFLAPAVGKISGREPLPCFTGPLRPHSLLFCAANRHYVRSDLARAARNAASRVASKHPGTVVRYLDGGFPVGGGFPMLPHITHGDGRRLDLALMWKTEDGTPTSGNGSPLGYFGYVRPPSGQAACVPAWLDLRWDFDVLQPILVRNELDVARTRTLLREVLRETAIRKVLLEPHVRRQLGVGDSRIRFQGCGAARHDDHMHIQL